MFSLQLHPLLHTLPNKLCVSNLFIPGIDFEDTFPSNPMISSMHRDVRWENIIRATEVKSKWFFDWLGKTLLCRRHWPNYRFRRRLWNSGFYPEDVVLVSTMYWQFSVRHAATDLVYKVNSFLLTIFSGYKARSLHADYLEAKCFC